MSFAETAPLSLSSTADEKFAVTTADQFQKLYYEAIDKRRHLISKMYLENAMLIWNGHGLNNSADIQKFYSTLAPTSHSITSVDSMFVPDLAVGDQKTIMINVAGSVLLKTEYNRATKSFNQTFMLTLHDDKWKIVSDVFRTQNAAGATTMD